MPEPILDAQASPEITRAEINRANAQHSTGPKTEQGKAHSRVNATKHGLTAQTLIMPAADLAALGAFTQKMIAALRPEGDLERNLVESLSHAQFQFDRTRAIENNLLCEAALKHTDQSDPTRDFPADYALGLVAAVKENGKTIDLLSRYGARHHRQFLQIHAALMTLQKDRAKLRQDIAQQHRQRQAEALAKREYAAACDRNHNGATDPRNQPHPRHSGFVSQPSQTPPDPRAAGPKTIRQIAGENRKNRAA